MKIFLTYYSISLALLNVYHNIFHTCVAFPFPVRTFESWSHLEKESNLYRPRTIRNNKAEEEDDKIAIYVNDKVEFFKSLLRKLAMLSLEDYKWRADKYKSNEADRMMEESIARIQGKEASYYRPMDAGEEKRGPLGRAERNAVTWLNSVIEGEAKRARMIKESDGSLVRPMDTNNGGPLADLENQAVSFLKKIADSESERFLLGKLRPMDLDDSKRSFLGEAEAMVVSTVNDIAESEKKTYSTIT